MKTEPRWFVRYRLAWIAETLRVFGFINRQHLQRKFDISEPQASLDLKAFQRQYPQAMFYDLNAKRYVVNNAADSKVAPLKAVADHGHLPEG